MIASNMLQKTHVYTLTLSFILYLTFALSFIGFAQTYSNQTGGFVIAPVQNTSPIANYYDPNLSAQVNSLQATVNELQYRLSSIETSIAQLNATLANTYRPAESYATPPAATVSSYTGAQAIVISPKTTTPPGGTTTTTPTPPTQGTAFYLQVGAYRDTANVDVQGNYFRTLGYSVYQQQENSPSGLLTRLLIGPFDAASLERVKQDLAARGVYAVVRRN